MAINVGIIISATNQTGAAVASAQRNLNGLNATVTQMSRSLNSFRNIARIAGATLAVAFGKQVLDSAKNLQAMQIRLSGVTGGFKQANAVFTELNAKFGPAGLDVGVLADGFTRLAASGLSLDKTRETISNLANATAAFGGDSQQLQRAVIGFSQVVGKGTLQMEELRQQIGEAVPVAMRIMANEAGVSVGEFTNQVTKGMISAERAIDLFNAGARKAFGDFAENLNATLVGSIGRIQAEFTAGLGQILANTNFDERLVEIFNVVADAIKNFLASIDNTKVDAFFGVIGLLVEKFQEALPIIQLVSNVILEVGTSIAAAIALIPGDLLAFGGMVGLAFFGKGLAQAAAIFGLVQIGIKFLQDIGVLSESIAGSLSAALPIGLIGFAFLGPVGGALVTILVTVLDRLLVYYKDSIVAILSFFDSASAQAFDAAVSKSNSVIGALKNMALQAASTKVQTDGLASSIFKFQGKDARGRTIQLTGNAALEAIRARQAKAASTVKIPSAIAGTFDQGAAAAERFAEKVERVRESLRSVIEDTQNGFEKISRELSGDELGAKLADVNKKFDDTNQKLREAIIRAEQINKKTGQEGDTIARLNDLLKQSNAIREQAIERERVLFSLKQQQEQAQARINTLQLQQSLSELQQKTDLSALGNVFAGTAAGQLDTQAAALRNQLSQQALAADKAIAEIREKLLTEQNPVIIEQLNKQLQLQSQLGATALQAANEMSASALLTQQAWQQVGDILEKSVGDALVGLVNGSKTLKDVMNDMWNSITKAAADYLVKLAEIELKQAILGSGGGSGGGGGFLGILGSLFGGGSVGSAGSSAAGIISSLAFANGGAFNGMVKPFANGDVIAGPTMFGIAGEAGNEAIMPLTRIGGKLGVRSEGGGNSYHITVQAIDTQTGMQFIGKHITQIDNHLRARKSLNRSSSLR